MDMPQGPRSAAPRLVSWGPAPVLRLDGGAYQQGKRHGEDAGGDIRFNLAAVRRDIAAAQPGRRKNYDYDAALRRNLAFIERTAPEVLDEIHGIADGANLPFREVLLLNVPVFIAAQFLPHDCTQILVTPPATADGRTYLAKTRDFNRGGFRQVVLHRRFADGRELIEVNTAGSVTWPGSGLSSDGLAISTSGVWSRRTVVDFDRLDRGWFLINAHLLLRDSRSLDEFEQRLRAQPRVTGLNIVAADRERGAAFEATVDRIVRHPTEEGVVVRTNHYLAKELTALSPTPDENPSSYHRSATAMARVTEQRGRWESDRLMALMGDHDGYPQRSICRHAVGGEGADTVYASIASLPDGRFWTILEHPCHAPVPASTGAIGVALATPSHRT